VSQEFGVSLLTNFLGHNVVFVARHYASAAFAIVGMSVCLSVTSDCRLFCCFVFLFFSFFLFNFIRCPAMSLT